MIATLPLPAVLPTRCGDLTLRPASMEDVPALIALMADDVIGPSRGDRGDRADVELYRRALEGVDADPSNEVVVGTDGDGTVVATFQITRIPSMSRRGSTRLQIEAVRVKRDLRSSGVGTGMMRWVVDEAAPAVGATLVQLTSDASREDAHRFYERLGFTASHRGYKLEVPAR